MNVASDGYENVQAHYRAELKDYEGAPRPMCLPLALGKQ